MRFQLAPHMTIAEAERWLVETATVTEFGKIINPKAFLHKVCQAHGYPYTVVIANENYQRNELSPSRKEHIANEFNKVEYLF